MMQSSPQQPVWADLVNRYKQLSHLNVQEKNRFEKQPETIRDWIDERPQALLKHYLTVVNSTSAVVKLTRNSPTKHRY